MSLKLIILVILISGLFKFSACFSQVYVDGVEIDTLETPFIQLIGSNGGDLNRTSILIDYGQRSVSLAFTRQRIAGPDKQPINFRSTVDALNFLVKQGWELAFFESGGTNIYIYMLK